MPERIVPLVKATNGIPMSKARKPKEFTLNSLYPSMKIDITADPRHFNFLQHTFGAGPISDGTHNILTLAHGYDYIPSAVVLIGDPRYSPEKYSMMNHYIFDPFTGSEYNFTHYVDDTNLIIQYEQSSGGFGASDKYFVANTTWNFKYYLFAETGLEV